MRSLGVTVIMAAVVLAAGCEDDFSPKGPFTRQPVVYSVLTNRSDTQVVRIYSTYDPPSFDPYGQQSDTPVLGATVTMNVEGTVVVFRETALPRSDPSRYNDSIAAYVAAPMIVRRGAAYRLTVETPDLGSLRGEITVPDPGAMTIQNRYVLDAPGSYVEDFSVAVQLSAAAYGFMVRIFVEYEVFQDGSWTTYREEVPQRVSGNAAAGSLRAEYPRLSRRQNEPRSALPGGTTVFTNRAYRWTVGSINSRHAAVPLRYRTATAVLYQTDLPFYVYYNLANGFQDEYSIRTDAPDYSNLEGGWGVFGSMTTDTLVVPLPDSVQ